MKFTTEGTEKHRGSEFDFQSLCLSVNSVVKNMHHSIQTLFNCS
jgi:hypothetical protein